MAKRIGIISDTHGLLRPEVKAILETCDCVLHAGDVNRPELLDEIRYMGDLYVVRGNNDWEWAENLSQTLTFAIEGVRFFMVHNKRDVVWNLADVQVVVFGHSHKYFQQEIDGRLWLNPGSCGQRRFDGALSMAVMTVENGKYEVEKVVF